MFLKLNPPPKYSYSVPGLVMIFPNIPKGSVDLAVVNHLININDDDIDKNVLLFHLQQAAEKFLKALLSKNGIHFEKTHDLIEFLELCSAHKIMLPEYTRSLVYVLTLA